MTELASTGGEVPCIFPAEFVGTFRSRDFDEVAAVACGWNQRYTKLAPGPFAGEVIQAHAARVQVGTASWSCAVLAAGAVPSGARTFALASSPRGRARISGCAIRPGELATRSDRDEFDFRTPDACELVVLSVEHGLLDRTAHMLFGTSWREVGGDSPIVRLRDLEGAEAALRRLLAAVRSDPT